MNIGTNGDNIIIDGHEITPPSVICGMKIMVISNNRIYANFREYKNGRWRVTLMAIWQCILP